MNNNTGKIMITMNNGWGGDYTIPFSLDGLTKREQSWVMRRLTEGQGGNAEISKRFSDCTYAYAKHLAAKCFPEHGHINYTLFRQMLCGLPNMVAALGEKSCLYWFKWPKHKMSYRIAKAEF